MTTSSGRDAGLDPSIGGAEPHFHPELDLMISSFPIFTHPDDAEPIGIMMEIGNGWLVQLGCGSHIHPIKFVESYVEARNSLTVEGDYDDARKQRQAMNGAMAFAIPLGGAVQQATGDADPGLGRIDENG